MTAQSASEDRGIIGLLEPAPADPRHTVNPLQWWRRFSGAGWSIVGASEQDEIGDGRAQQELFLGTTQPAKVQPRQPALAFRVGE